MLCRVLHSEDEGGELFGKRGSEFKLPYPIVDPDPSGFGAALEEEDVTKIKPNTKKKSKTQLKDYLQAGRKRKTPYREVYSGLNGYAASAYNGINGYPGYSVADMKNEFLSPYAAGSNPASNLALETAADLYRSGGYSSFPAAAAASVYPSSADGLRLDIDRQSYANGYYLDSVTRSYPHSLQYPAANGYGDLITHAKYPYDVSKYSYDSFVGGYGLDLSKRANYYDTSKYDATYRTYDSAMDKMSRLNGSYESLRKASLYDNSAPLSGGIIGAGGGGSEPPTITSPNCSLNTPDLSSRSSHTASAAVYGGSKETLNNYQATPSGGVHDSHSAPVTPQLETKPLSQYTSVIRSTSPRNNKSPVASQYATNSAAVALTSNSHPMSQNCSSSSSSAWTACAAGKSGVTSPSTLHIQPTSTVSDTTSTLSDPSPTSANTPTVADHDRYVGEKYIRVGPNDVISLGVEFSHKSRDG